MRRLVVQCTCGERIQVPQSALGKSGLCPSCGITLQITKDNSTAYRPGSEPAKSPSQPQSGSERGWSGSVGSANAPEDIRRRFAEGVDLYFAKRYSEALVIFNTLAAMLPQDADIQMGQTMCLNALRKLSPFGLGYDGISRQLEAPEQIEARAESLLNGPTPELNEDFFKRFLFDKMLRGGSDEIQMRAAELAAKMFGFIEGGKPKDAQTDNLQEPIADATVDDAHRPTPFRRAAAPDDLDR